MSSIHHRAQDQNILLLVYQRVQPLDEVVVELVVCLEPLLQLEARLGGDVRHLGGLPGVLLQISAQNSLFDMTFLQS